MSDELALSKYALEVLEKNTETLGRVKGAIDLLAKDIQALTREMQSSAAEEKGGHDRISARLEEINDIVKSLTKDLNSFDMAKIVEQISHSQKELETKFEPLAKAGLAKTLAIEKTLTDKKEERIENVKGKWALVVAVSTAIAGAIIAIVLYLIGVPTK